MINIPSIDANSLQTQNAAYSAVNIKINNPKANISNPMLQNNNANAVNLEVNNPSLTTEESPIYNYPTASEIVTYDKCCFAPVELPQIPAMTPVYQQTVINNTIPNKSLDSEEQPVKVPEPYLTNTEAEKAPAFHGLSFKANSAQNEVEIVPAEVIKPEIDINDAVAKLKDRDFDIQAQQIKTILALSIEEPEKAKQFIVNDIFTTLIDITNMDSSSLEKPSKLQLEIREKFIKNLKTAAKAKSEGKEINESELPFQLTKEELALAQTLAPIEQAERNKDYAITTLAVLAKLYAEESEKASGNVIPMTDLPGISAIVDTLRKSQNPEVKESAIAALMQFNRDEYKEELASVFEITSRDENPYVALTAIAALSEVTGKSPEELISELEQPSA